MTSEHLPERYYSECQFHICPEWEDFDDPEEYDDAEIKYWDEHFYGGDDDQFIACEDSFVGICCIACTEENDDWIVPWPCEQAVITDYIIEQALQKSQNPLQPRADSLALA